MDSATRRLVVERADDRCEYCHLAQEHEPFATFHVEHTIAKQRGGDDDPSNHCLACSNCNFRKGPNIASISRDTNQLVPLFHPRRDDWTKHFAWQGAELIGKTSNDRVTIELLGINLAENVEHRETLIAEGVFVLD